MNVEIKKAQALRCPATFHAKSRLLVQSRSSTADPPPSARRQEPESPSPPTQSPSSLEFFGGEGGNEHRVPDPRPHFSFLIAEISSDSVFWALPKTPPNADSRNLFRKTIRLFGHRSIKDSLIDQKRSRRNKNTIAAPSPTYAVGKGCVKRVLFLIFSRSAAGL